MRLYYLIPKSAIVAVAFVLALAGAARADSLTHKNGQTYQNCSIDSYVISNGVGYLVVRLANADGTFSPAYSLPSTDVMKAEFGASGSGKPGSLTALTESKSFPNVTVTMAETHPQYGLVFQITDNDDLEAAGPLKVPASRIQQIQFQAQAAPTSDTTSGDGSSMPSSDSSSGFSSGSGNDSEMSEEEARRKVEEMMEDLEDDEGFGGGGSMALLGLLGVGIGVLIGILALVLLMAIVINSFIILAICKIGGIPEITYKKTFLCALFLGLLPIPCFLLLLIPFIGPFAAILLWAGGSRAIVMGTLEVLEGTAWTIMAAFIGSTWLLNKLIADFMT